MTLYKIPCSWEMYGIMYIEAENIEEAIKKAEDEEPLPKGNYIDASFRIDYDTEFLLDYGE